MNNSVFRKKLNQLRPVSTSICSKSLDKLGTTNKKSIETEARFGVFKGTRFVPGVTKRQYDAVMKHMEVLGWKKVQSIDKVTSRSLSRTQTVRKVETGSNTYYEVKDKLVIVDVLPNYRLAKSRELRNDDFKGIFEGANSKNQYTKIRARTSYINDNIRVDFTNEGLQVEVEFVGRKGVCAIIEKISEILEDVRTSGVVFMEYKALLGPRFGGPLPQTLTLDDFKKKILTKQPYSVTEKADGERYLLFIDSSGRFYFISRGMDITPAYDGQSKPDFAGTILDGELYKNDFYTFDVLFINGMDVRSKKLPERLIDLYNVLLGIRNNKLKMKNFLVDDGKNIIEYPSRTNTGIKNIYEAAKAVWNRKSLFPYPLDGLIFTPTNDKYFSKNILKWKDENTIDFYYDKNRLFLAGFDKKGEHYNIYPFSGLDGNGTFRSKKGLVKNSIFTDPKASEKTRNGILNTPIAGLPGVGEFAFVNNSFKLIRKRPDKKFPNGIDSSNQVWESITNPLTINELSTGPGAMRDFHSEIKSKLIMKYAKNKSVIDIGSGKGEDVAKYVKAESKPVVGFDIVQEEYPHPDYMTFHKVPSEIYEIKKYVKQKFDVININFAIHYFFKNKKTFESLVTNIYDNIKKGGIVMATVLDGKLVYDTLKGKNKVNTNKYTMTKKYKNSSGLKLLGQEVEVLVKGTKYFNRPISEFLFHFDKFLIIMSELGFELVEKGNFQDFCAGSEWCTRYMTEAEKDYSFKNMFFILKKT